MTTMNIEELCRDCVKKLTPYSTARDEFEEEAMVKLDANENPFKGDYNRYPDPYQKDLKARIAELKSVEPSQIFLGNGSDEAIDLLFRAFCNPGRDNVVSIAPSYGMYKVSAGINDVEIRQAALNIDFSLNKSLVFEQIDDYTKLIFLCSPNNPSGNILDPDTIKEIAVGFNGLVIIDEAYIDFSNSKSWIHQIDENPNIVILQTFSKAFGLAALRLGMAFGSEELIQVLNKIKPPYNINQATQLLAMERLDNVSEIRLQVHEIVRERDLLSENLAQIAQVIKVYPSEANFLLVKFENANELFKYLIHQDIVVRNRTSQLGCEGCLRLTIGTSNENQLLIDNIKQFYS